MSDALEARLDRLTSAFTGFVKQTESDRQKSQLDAYERKLQSDISGADVKIGEAEAAVARATEEGDPQMIARAHRALTEAVADKKTAEFNRQRFLDAKADAEKRTGGSSGAPGKTTTDQPKLDTTQLDRWKGKHKSWYGVDTDMTKAAHEIAKTIESNGVIERGTQAYFEAIDRQMAQKFPDKLRSAPNTSGGGQPSPDGDAALMGRIPRDVIEGWRRMGINVDDDAVMKSMVANRQKLADKSILPKEPEYGRIFI